VGDVATHEVRLSRRDGSAVIPLPFTSVRLDLQGCGHIDGGLLRKVADTDAGALTSRMSSTPVIPGRRRSTSRTSTWQCSSCSRVRSAVGAEPAGAKSPDSRWRASEYTTAGSSSTM